MTTTEENRYHGYDIVPMRQWSQWCASVYPTRGTGLPPPAFAPGRAFLSIFVVRCEEAPFAPSSGASSFLAAP